MHEEQESPTRNTFKVISFTSAIKVLKRLDHPLRSVEEARSVRQLTANYNLLPNLWFVYYS